MRPQDAILENLTRVQAEREARAVDERLAASVQSIKHYQAARFRHSYRDLAAQPRHARATEFFLNDLYGPQDFTARDAQFARIVPAISRLFPDHIVLTVQALSELHALSESLDTRMGRVVQGADVDIASYVQAWRAVGERAQRERQIALTLEVGRALDALTRKPMLRTTLRMMRGPAAAAGLQDLQAFLETGFDTFREMNGAQGFLATIDARESALIDLLFSSTPVTDETFSGLFP